VRTPARTSCGDGGSSGNPVVEAGVPTNHRKPSIVKQDIEKPSSGLLGECVFR